jgi:hypothetical protein
VITGNRNQDKPPLTLSLHPLFMLQGPTHLQLFFVFSLFF